MSSFIETLKADIRWRNSALDKADRLYGHAQVSVQRVCDHFNDFSWEQQGRTTKLYGRTLKAGWFGHRRELLVEFYPNDSVPGHLFMMVYDTGAHQTVHSVNIIDKLSIEQHIREAVVDWHTVGKYK